MNWKYFVSASILMGALALKFGAPPAAVLAGIALAGLWNWKGGRLRR